MAKEDRLRSAIKREVQTSNSYLGGELADQRRDAMERYLGEPYGNEQEGRSQVVSTDVQDTIESIMPDFVEIFGSGDRICQFDPWGEEDKEIAAQATDYVNYVWNVDNPGFEIVYDWVKDALLQKNGFVKTSWSESESVSEHTYENLNAMTLAELLDDPEIEVIEQEEKPAGPGYEQAASEGVLWDIKVKRTRKQGRVKVEVIPPEEIGFTRYARSLYDADCVWHKTEKTISDLIQMGFEKKDLADVPSDDEQLFNEERLARHADEDDFPPDDDPADETMRKVWVYEVYIKFDWDGDDIAEWRQVFCAGTSYKILKRDGAAANESVEDHPFDTITPIRMPHRTVGRSVADLVMDIQQIKTSVQRQLLDNMYGLNNNRYFINEDVSLDDYLTQRPGGAVRVRGSTAVTQAAAPIQIQALGQPAYALLEYFDGVRETRTGVTRYNQGLDASSLNDTAAGMNMILSQARARMKLIARLFAETGFKRVMLRILKILIAHQDKPRTVRIRNKWVEMDPRTWNSDMDVTVQVGLGEGTAQARQAMLMNILGIQKEAIALQAGVDGPLVTLEKIFNTLDQLAKASGFRNADMFFTDPSTEEMKQLVEMKKQNQQPPPEIQIAQMEDAREREKNQLAHQEKMARLEHDRDRTMQDIAVKREQGASDAEISRMELHLREIELEIKAAEAGQRLKIESENSQAERASKDLDGRLRVAESNKELLEKEPEIISTAIVDAVSQLKELVGPLTQAARRVGGGKQFVRDESGEIVAVRHEDGTVQQVMRDQGGNMMGLETLQ